MSVTPSHTFADSRDLLIPTCQYKLPIGCQYFLGWSKRAHLQDTVRSWRTGRKALMVRQLSGGAGELYLKIAMESEIARICFPLTLQSLKQQLLQGNQIMGWVWVYTWYLSFFSTGSFFGPIFSTQNVKFVSTKIDTGFFLKMLKLLKTSPHERNFPPTDVLRSVHNKKCQVIGKGAEKGTKCFCTRPIQSYLN